jgi:hypothetical protein
LFPFADVKLSSRLRFGWLQSTNTKMMNELFFFCSVQLYGHGLFITLGMEKSERQLGDRIKGGGGDFCYLVQSSHSSITHPPLDHRYCINLSVLSV